MNSRVEIAYERLERALQRIDTALARKAVGNTADLSAAALAAENAELRRSNAEIGERLDRAIARIQAILKR
jgi:hypothetical protein